MGKKRITFYIYSELHDKFKKVCEKNGIVMSRKIEMLMDEYVKKVVEK